MGAVPMSHTPPGSDRAPFFMRLLGGLLRPWLKIKTEPSEPAALVLPGDGVPVVYMLERYGLSNALILEEACRAHGLPAPLKPMPGGHLRKGKKVLALSRRDGAFIQRPRSRTHSEGLSNLLAAVEADPELDIRLVPVSIYVGRAPARTTGWFGVLFSENWVVVGRFRRLLAILLNGRDTIVHFSTPTSLREVVAEGLPHERTVRKASRVLRAHFARLRAAVIGPDLSHRRTVIESI